MPYLERATRAGQKPSVDDSDCLFGHRTGSCRFAASCEKFVRVPKKTGALRGGYGLTPFTGSATVPVPLNEVQQGPARRLAEAMRDQLVKSDIPAANGPKGLEGLASVAMLNLAQFPAVDIELASLDNLADAAMAESPQGRRQYAAMQL